jgi:hypothetical protein
MAGLYWDLGEQDVPEPPTSTGSILRPTGGRKVDDMADTDETEWPPDEG